VFIRGINLSSSRSSWRRRREEEEGRKKDSKKKKEKKTNTETSVFCFPTLTSIFWRKTRNRCGKNMLHSSYTCLSNRITQQ